MHRLVLRCASLSMAGYKRGNKTSVLGVFLRFKPTDLSDSGRNKSIATLFSSFIDQRIKERKKFDINEETRPRYLRIKMEIVPIDLLSWLIDT